MAAPVGGSGCFGLLNDTTRAWDDAWRRWASSTIWRISKSNRADNCSRIARTSATIGSRIILVPRDRRFDVHALRHGDCHSMWPPAPLPSVAATCSALMRAQEPEAGMPLGRRSEFLHEPHFIHGYFQMLQQIACCLIADIPFKRLARQH